MFSWLVENGVNVFRTDFNICGRFEDSVNASFVGAVSSYNESSKAYVTRIFECVLYRLGLTAMNTILTAERSVGMVWRFGLLSSHHKLALHQNHVFTAATYQRIRDWNVDFVLAVLTRTLS